MTSDAPGFWSAEVSQNVTKVGNRYRLYVDEYGDNSTADGALRNNPLLTLVGVAFEWDYYRISFQPALERMKRDCLRSHPDAPIVLHRHDIIHKRGAFGFLQDSQTCANFDAQLLSLIRDSEFVLFAVVVDKAANKERYGLDCRDQYGYALAGLVARYCGWLNRSAGGRGDVMAEARNQNDDGALKRVYQELCQQGTSGYPGPRPLPASVFQKALTTRELKFARKAENIAGLQLADLLTKIGANDSLLEYGRCGLHLGTFSQQIRESVQEKYNRNRYDGRVKGIGKIVIAPS